MLRRRPRTFNRQEGASVIPDYGEVTWTEIEDATSYELDRARDRLTAVSTPLTICSHTDTLFLRTVI